MQHDEKAALSQEGAFTIRPEYKPKSIRSYVIRAGRMTEGQQKAFERWWPTYGLSLHDGLLDVEAEFGRAAPLVIEIGFGMGDSLLEMAKNAPDTNFIGIEVHPPGVGRLINNAGLEGVKNLRVYMADAVDVLQDCIAESSVDRCQLYFPDPWHKKKHHKRRIVQLPFVAEIRRVLSEGGHFHLATDWEDYADHMMEVMSCAPRFSNASSEYVFAQKPEYRPNTKFERRGEKLGHGVWDLLFEAIES